MKTAVDEETVPPAQPERGEKLVLIGSVMEKEEGEKGEKEENEERKYHQRVFEIEFPYIDNIFTGTGDVFASVFLSALIHAGNPSNNTLPSYEEIKKACEVSV